MGRIRLTIAGAVLVSSCGGGTGAVTTQPTIVATSIGAAPTTAATTTTVGAVAGCEDGTTEILLGTAVDGAVVGRSQPPPERLYFCVAVPEGTTGVTVELTGASAALYLFVAHPDLATLQNGGLYFWVGEEAGSGGRSVVVEPVGEGFVPAGTYYIEVSPEDFTDSSAFTLLVSASY